MLDKDGFVSETNATNIFMINRAGQVLTPFADACLPGITRARILTLATSLGLDAKEQRLSLFDFYSAAEVFTTGTMCGVVPVGTIDGRKVGWGAEEGEGKECSSWPVTQQLQDAYMELTKDPSYGDRIPDA